MDELRSSSQENPLRKSLMSSSIPITLDYQGIVGVY